MMRTIPTKSLILALVTLGGLTMLSGCSDNNSNPTNSNGGQHSSHFKTVAISNFAFSPASVTVAPGDTVRWTNNDTASHTVTSDTGSELDSPQLSQGQTYQHIFGTAGSFAYHCAVHPTMHGAVTVQ